MEWAGIDREEWEGLAALAPLQQTWRWGDVLAGTGARVERRAAREAAGAPPLALAQVVTRRVGPVAVSLLSRGPVRLAAGAELPVGALLRGLGPGGGRLSVVTPESGGVAGAVPIVTPAWHAELDLSPPVEALRQGLDPKLRNKIARAERAGLRVGREDGPASRHAWLLREEAAQQRQRRYRNWPPELVDAWHAAGGEVRVHVACKDGVPLAAMLFLVHGRVATYHIGWAGAEGRRAAAHPLCLWRAIVELKADGIERIDLGTVNTEDAPGLARFKIATGATVRPLGATCLMLPGVR
jgi:hypothetical protein